MQSLLFQSENQENDNEQSSSRFKCDSTFAFKQGLNRHWKGVHHHSLDTLAAPSCNKKGKMSLKLDKVPRFSCPFDSCEWNPFINVLQLASAHCKTDHDMDLG